MVDETEGTPETTETPETLAVAQGQPIDNADIVAKFNTTLRTAITNAVAWYTGAGLDTYFPTQLLYNKDPGGFTEANLGTTVVANTLSSVISTWAKRYTAVRNLAWSRVYVRHYHGNYTDYSATALTSMLPNATTQTEVVFYGGTSTHNTGIEPPGSGGWVGNSINGRYFSVMDNAGRVAVVVYTAAPPALPAGCYRAINVLVGGGDNYVTLASKVSAALNADSKFKAGWGGPIWNGAKYYTYVQITSEVEGLNLASQQNTWADSVGTSAVENYVQTGIPSTNINNRAALDGILPGSPVTASGFNNYIQNLYTMWNNAKANSISYTTYWCHNNCHGSCHHNRDRR